MSQVLPTGKSFERLDSFPIDISEKFTSHADAINYAQSNPTAWIGQIISIEDSGIARAFIIQPDKTLTELGSGGTGGSSLLGEQSFKIGDIVWQDAELDIPNGWLGSNVAFSQIDYPALYALLGTAVTPIIPDIDGKKGIIFALYVNTLTVTANGFAPPTGQNLDIKNGLIIATNTIIGKMNDEDQEKSEINIAIGGPVTPSAGLDTTFSGITNAIATITNKIESKGVDIPDSADTLFKIIDYIDQIDSVSDSIRIISFTTTVPVFNEKGAGLNIPSIPLAWEYFGEEGLKSQFITIRNNEGQILYNIQLDITLRNTTINYELIDNTYIITLHAINNNDREINRNITIDYQYPTYEGITESYEISAGTVLTGKKIVQTYNPTIKKEYDNINGYMFFAIPTEWSEYKTMKDPHGFDFMVNSVRKVYIDINEIPYLVYITNKDVEINYYYFTFSS